MGIDELRKANPHLIIRDSLDPRLALYGKRIDPKPFAAMIELADRVTDIDPSSNKYVASCADLEADPAAKLIALRFGSVAMQIGYCNGPSTKLNALEWHKSAEIDIAVTDLVLLLGKRSDIDANGFYDSSLLDCFYLERGIALELAPEVLHFSPCAVKREGFKSIIALPSGTNDPLAPGEKAAAEAAFSSSGDIEFHLLFMRDKWLIAHPERKVLLERGAFAGIRGKNIEIEPL